MNFIKRLFSDKNVNTYTELEEWIAKTLGIDISRLAVNKYYIKDGFWFVHEHFNLERRTIVDDISETNRIWNTHKIRPATDEEIECFYNLKTKCH